MQRKKLPIGIQTFEKIREAQAYYYVDKTAYALQLIDQGSHYFLSRPRRFGKSLFLDTLKELFEGNRPLFEGLYAENHWDWSVKYPVIRISLGGGVVKTQTQLQALLDRQLLHLEKQAGLTPTEPDASRRLHDLLLHLSQQNGQRVVVLIDEYDKPILDNLSEPSIATEMRDALRNLYAVLKDNDANLKFVFITGVSKFSKVSLFSGLNNLEDLTVRAEYSALCGYTEQDLDLVFGPELPNLDRAKIRAWYNGYNWLGESVYNPFDLLLFFRERQFKSFWFETGTPTFLVEFLAQNHWFTPDLWHRESSDSILSHFDVEQIAPEALLWQTGYLTFHKVKQKRSGNWIYTLGYPNREVESALNEALLPAYGPEAQPALVSRSHLEDALYNHDLKALHESLFALFASIPYEWYRRSPLANFEGHYASVFYSQLAALGLNVQAEDMTNKGRIDLSLRLDQQVYLFEFKVTEAIGERASQTDTDNNAVEDKSNGEALQQLLDKGYAEKYRAPGVLITLIGIEFSRKERNIVRFDSLQLDSK
jgi:hypothetical protein